MIWNGNMLQVDMSAGVAAVMSSKEDSELATMKKACQVSVDIFNKFLKDQVMDIIDAEKVSNTSIKKSERKAADL